MHWCSALGRSEPRSELIFLAVLKTRPWKKRRSREERKEGEEAWLAPSYARLLTAESVELQLRAEPELREAPDAAATAVVPDFRQTMVPASEEPRAQSEPLG